MKICLDSEAREREERERLEEQCELDKGMCEAEKERVMKEVTEQLNHDHRMEMEAVRSRFIRVMTSMERSPSECSLEKIEVSIFGNIPGDLDYPYTLYLELNGLSKKICKFIALIYISRI